MSVWLVLVHPCHDHLIDSSVHATQQDAQDYADLIDSAVEEKRLESQTWLHARKDGNAGDAIRADENYTAALKSLHASWEPRLGQFLYDRLGDIEFIEVIEKEIRTMPDYTDQYEYPESAPAERSQEDQTMVTLAQLKAKIFELSSEQDEAPDEDDLREEDIRNSFHNVLGLSDNQEIVSVRPVKYLVEVKTTEENYGRTSYHIVKVS